MSKRKQTKEAPQISQAVIPTTEERENNNYVAVLPPTSEVQNKLIEDWQGQASFALLGQFKSSEDGEAEFGDNRPIALAVLANATATANFELSWGLLNQVARSFTSKSSKADAFNAALGALRGFAPRDVLEAQLAAQAIATHNAAMRFQGMAADADTPENCERMLALASKMTRAYIDLVDSLHKYRNRGQQLVRVEHVNVNAGGQANIVGSVNTYPGGSDEKVG